MFSLRMMNGIFTSLWLYTQQSHGFIHDFGAVGLGEISSFGGAELDAYLVPIGSIYGILMLT